MILNKLKEGWDYLAVKRLSTFLRGITSKHHGDFCCFSCRHSFRTEKKIIYIAKNITHFEKKKIFPLTKEGLKSYHYTGKYRGVAHSIFNLKLNVPNRIPAVFHSDSNYDYHFITKKLLKEFDGQF